MKPFRGGSKPRRFSMGFSSLQQGGLLRPDPAFEAQTPTFFRHPHGFGKLGFPPKWAQPIPPSICFTQIESELSAHSKNRRFLLKNASLDERRREPKATGAGWDLRAIVRGNKKVHIRYIKKCIFYAFFIL